VVSALACNDDLTSRRSLPIGGAEAGSAGLGGVTGEQAGTSPTAGFGSSQAGTAGSSGIGFAGSAGVNGQAAAGAAAGTTAGFASAPEQDGGAGGAGGASGDYEPCPAIGEVCAILPLGDSIALYMRLFGLKPAAHAIRMCCMLPWHQRRSRATQSGSVCGSQPA